MAKLGKYEFPEIGLLESVEITRKLYDELGGDARRDSLAIYLGLSPSGGTFGARINALRLWGLASGRGSIKLTPAGIQISSPTSPTEERQALRRLAASIPLFNVLHDRIGNANANQIVLTAKLHEITGVEMSEVKRRVPTIQRIFEGIREHLATPDDELLDQIAANQSNANNENLDPLPRGWIQFSYDDGTLRMRETPANLEMLIATLESRRDRLNN